MNIYLDIDDTLIHEDFADIGQPAAGLPEFIMALRPHEVYWLTTHCMDGDPLRAQELVKSVLSEELHPDIDRDTSNQLKSFVYEWYWYFEQPENQNLTGQKIPNNKELVS